MFWVPLRGYPLLTFHMKPLDLLDLLSRIGFSIRQSDTGIWYAKKVHDGHSYVFGCDDINLLYKLCMNTPIEYIKYV